MANSYTRRKCYIYSWTPLSWTLKGNEKQFEIADSLMTEKQGVWEWVWIRDSGVFEVTKFKIARFDCIA